MLIWPINVKVLITTKDESMIKTEEIPTFDEQKIIKDILREPENIDKLRFKINTFYLNSKHEPIDILVLKWMVALNEEFISKDCLIFLLSINSASAHLTNEETNYYQFPSVSLLESFDSLCKNGFIDYVAINGKEFLKVNNTLILKDLFKKDIILLEQKLAFIFNTKFYLASENDEIKQIFYTLVVDCVSNIEFKENENILLSDIYFKLGAFVKEKFRDIQMELIYFKKCENLRILYCPDDEGRICGIKNAMGLYYINNAKYESDFKLAIEYLEDALSYGLSLLAIKKYLDRDILSCYSNLGFAYLKTGEFINSKFYLLSALSFLNLSRIIDHEAEMIIYNNLSVACRETENYKLALEFVDKALSVPDDGKFQKQRIEFLKNKGYILNVLNKFNEAIECFHSAHTLVEKLKEKNYYMRDFANFYVSYGLMLKKIGEKIKSEEFFNKAYLIERSSSNHSLKSSTLIDVEAVQLFEKGEPYSAEKSTIKAKIFENSLGFRLAQINTLVNQGLLLRSKNKLIDCLICLYDALVLTYKLNQNYKRIRVLNSIGQLFLEDFSHYTLSLHCYSQAYDISIKIFEYHDSFEMANTFLGMAMCFNYLDKFEASINFALKSSKILEKIFENNNTDHVKNNDLWVLYDLIAANYKELGKSEEQVLYLEKCLNKLYTLLPNYFTCEEIGVIKANAIDPVVNLANSSWKAEKLKESIKMVGNKIEEKKKYEMRQVFNFFYLWFTS